MLIDIKKLLTGREEHAAGEFEADLSGESFPGGFSLKAPVRIAYDARRQGDGARLEMDILCQAVSNATAVWSRWSAPITTRRIICSLRAIGPARIPSCLSPLPASWI